MKRIIYLFLAWALLSTYQANSQVTIGSGEKPDENALLDLKQYEDGTSDKGLLIPRLKLAETTDSSPLDSFVEGLIIYNIESVNDVEPGFYYCDGSRWILLKPSDDTDLPTIPWLIADTDLQASFASDNMYHTGDILIGRSGNVNSSAGLEVYSESKGLLMPRLSKGQRDAIDNPVESLIIWNTDEGCYNFYTKTGWRSMCGDSQNEESTAVVNCSGVIPEGTYKVGEPLNSDNFVNVTVQVSGASNLRIEGVTSNGFYFQRAGKVPTAGTYTYKIPGAGTPRTAENTIVSFNMYNNGKLIDSDDFCKKTITINPADATFEFTSFDSAQELTKGMPASGKTLTVTIDVTAPGTFNFYSDTISGVQYTTNNIKIDQTGTRQITLFASGTPTKTGDLIFTLDGSGNATPSTSAMNPMKATVKVGGQEAAVVIDCETKKVVGDYILNTATTTANYIECSVNITSIGTWTGSTNTVSELYFEGSGSATKTGSQTVRLYAKGTPNSLGDKNLIITINNDTCHVTVPILVPPKNILFIGKVSSSMSTALMDTQNFGPSGKSKITSIKIIDGGNNPTAATLVDLINTNKIDIILAGWNFNCQDQAAQVIANFIKDKKGYYFQVQSQGRAANLKLILDKAYGTDLTFTGDGYPLRAAQFPATDHPILNGVFGDCRNKYIRGDDNNSWLGIQPGTTNSSIESFLKIDAYGNYPARDLFSYADGFFMIPDWGSLNYTSSTYGSNSPIGSSTSDFTNTTVWTTDGGYNSRLTVTAGNIINWVLFGNAMDYIFSYTEENTKKDVVVTQTAQ